jgi:hypothetical protein
MIGRLNDQGLLLSFRPDEAVPHDHAVRKIAAVLDLSWIHSELALFYPKMGYRNQDRIPTAAKLIFIRFAHDRRFVGLVFVVFLFLLIHLIIFVGISRRCCVACDGENLVNTGGPFLLQPPVKLYRIDRHLVLLLTRI